MLVDEHAHEHELEHGFDHHFAHQAYPSHHESATYAHHTSEYYPHHSEEDIVAPLYHHATAEYTPYHAFEAVSHHDLIGDDHHYSSSYEGDFARHHDWEAGYGHHSTEAEVAGEHHGDYFGHVVHRGDHHAPKYATNDENLTAVHHTTEVQHAGDVHPVVTPLHDEFGLSYGVGAPKHAATHHEPDVHAIDKHEPKLTEFEMVHMAPIDATHHETADLQDGHSFNVHSPPRGHTAAWETARGGDHYGAESRHDTFTGATEHFSAYEPVVEYKKHAVGEEDYSIGAYERMYAHHRPLHGDYQGEHHYANDGDFVVPESYYPEEGHTAYTTMGGDLYDSHHAHE